ncbi:hypothetical protein B296_00023156 [Ensete ventricosum]|uniref:DET1- and DDB1-associated protein 1 domain-containing protein n=1 Tax=Ensete ventricosum TaxID=4639 RepID=A0A427AWW8_ENSVE|nr:hypothetical protein B296_00023156 [Ensete ventricosum]
MKTENCCAAPPLAEGAAAKQPSGADRTARGASKYLAGLPSRGLFSSAVLSSNPGGMRVYVCDHETAPPEGQVIKTNTTNILIRALQINKQKSDAKDVIAKSAADSSTVKRSAVTTSERRSPPKKMKTSSASTSHRGTLPQFFSCLTMWDEKIN